MLIKIVTRWGKGPQESITFQLLSAPHFFYLCKKLVYQSIQRHTGLTHPFIFYDIWALCCSVLSARVPENKEKIKMGGLDQFGPEHFEVHSFDTTGLERVNH